MQSKVRKRNRLAEEHLWLATSIANQISETLPVHVDFDDLRQAGLLGLLDAADRYSPDRGVKFSSFAKFRIRGAILDYLRDLDWASRDMRRQQKELASVYNDLANRLQREPDLAELAGELGIDVEKLGQRIKASMLEHGLVSASFRTGGDGDDLPPSDFAAPGATRPDSVASQNELRGFLDKALNTLPERYRRVISLYHFRELTMRQVGDVLGVNESRVSQMHQIALKRMRAVLLEEGIPSAQAF